MQIIRIRDLSALKGLDHCPIRPVGEKFTFPSSIVCTFLVSVSQGALRGDVQSGTSEIPVSFFVPYRHEEGIRLPNCAASGARRSTGPTHPRRGKVPL